jgi:hypothetical protein
VRKKVSNDLEYDEFVDHIIETYQFEKSYVKFPGICPSWDNTARKGDKAFYFKNATPEKFEEWLLFIKNNFKGYSKDENLVFINAWNEWGEGNHLEPCQKWGQKYLKAVKNVVKN